MQLFCTWAIFFLVCCLNTGYLAVFLHVTVQHNNECWHSKVVWFVWFWGLSYEHGMRVELYVVYSTARVDMWGRLTITNISYKKLRTIYTRIFFRECTVSIRLIMLSEKNGLRFNFCKRSYRERKCLNLRLVTWYRSGSRGVTSRLRSGGSRSRDAMNYLRRRGVVQI